MLDSADAANLADTNARASLRNQAIERLQAHGYALLSPQATAHIVDTPLTELTALTPHWERLPPDEHLKDGGRYRQRRHGSFRQEGPGLATLHDVPHRAHWQPTIYNALHGGMLRWFAPLEASLAEAPALRRLVLQLGQLFDQASHGGATTDATTDAPTEPWFIEVHPFRIDTGNGVGRPTPEGAHRDGVDYVAVLLVAREGVRGGETRVFQADSPRGVRFTLQLPWSALLLDDPRVVHETTPLMADLPTAPNAAPGAAGHRDTLVITYRRGGFQAP